MGNNNQINSNINIQQQFQTACKEGNLYEVKTLLNNYSDIDISKDNEYAFRWACCNGHLDVAQYLWSLWKFPAINLSAYSDAAFVSSCRNGHLKVAKWLFSLYKFYVSNSMCKHAFVSSCKNGHLHIIEWLLNVKPNINISANDEYAFISACENGHLSVAKYLLKMSPNINISAYNENSIASTSIKLIYVAQYMFNNLKPNYQKPTECAFLGACKNNHLHVAQWLLQIKPKLNISEANHFAFKSACQSKHLQLIKWICTLDPFKYSFELYDDKSINGYISNCKKYTIQWLLYGFNNKGYNNMIAPSLFLHI